MVHDEDQSQAVSVRVQCRVHGVHGVTSARAM